MGNKDFHKSPSLNTGGKMSNSSLQNSAGYNRASMPRPPQEGARTTSNWMQK